MEVDVAFEETVDATVVSGPASKETVYRFIYEARRLGVCSIVDMMDVSQIRCTSWNVRNNSPMS